MNACFLDTSAVLDLFRRRPPVLAAVNSYDELLLPHVALGELIAGAHGAADPAVELARLETWLLAAQVVGADQETAHVYGELLGILERQGRRIPTNDLWIAAAAVQFDLPLLARDEHFGRLQRLRWVSY